MLIFTRIFCETASPSLVPVLKHQVPQSRTYMIFTTEKYFFLVAYYLTHNKYAWWLKLSL